MPRWEIRIQRVSEQIGPEKTRTVGTYQVFRDGVPATERLLSGTTAEAVGPSGNDETAKDKRRILPGTYPLRTTDGPMYMTHRYRQDERIGKVMPGVELRNTGVRTDILIHPGKNEFLSSVGCINPCTSLPGPAVRIDYPGSRARVIAIIEDMKRFLGAAFPGENGRNIPNAFAVIDGDP